MRILQKLSMATAGTAFMTLGAGGAAHAITFFPEVEPNNTFATAQDVSLNDGGINVAGSRVGNSSPDFFRFLATAGDVLALRANVTGSNSGDPVLGLYDVSGTQITVNDDSNHSSNSLIRNFTITSSGIYAGAVSGNDDFNFDGVSDFGFGEISSNFTYEFQVTGATPVPVPEFSSGLGILALGACGAVAQLKSKLQKHKSFGSAFSNH